MNIERRKIKLIREFGVKPTICFYYYLYNVVDYRGEDKVRESFDSIKGQGDEVILGCYLPTDKTEALSKEYGFKIVKIRKDSRNNFPESRIRNKVTINTKCNFLVPLNINVVYEKGFDKIIKDCLKAIDVSKYALKVRYNFEDSNGRIGRRQYGFSYVFYRPYLLYARGYDDRTSYAFGSQKYGVSLLQDIYKLRTKIYDSSMYHRYHNDIKIPMMHKLISRNFIIDDLKIRRGALSRRLISELCINFPSGVKNVENSYW